jgi:pentose-5-phosphate-3-epimerase
LVQAEPCSTIHLHRVLSRIRALGKKAGALLDPGSPGSCGMDAAITILVRPDQSPEPHRAGKKFQGVAVIGHRRKRRRVIPSPAPGGL